MEEHNPTGEPKAKQLKKEKKEKKAKKGKADGKLGEEKATPPLALQHQRAS